MRRTRVSGALVLIALVAGAPGATAAEETQRAPFGAASHRTESSCLAGATCRGIAQAGVEGRVIARSELGRRTPVQGEELQQASGALTVQHRVGARARSVTATFTWLVSGSVRATSSQGLIEAALRALASAPGCGPACQVSTGSTTVLSDSSGDRPPLVTRLSELLAPARRTVVDEPVSVTVTARGILPRWLTVSSTALAEVAGGPAPTCTAGPPPACEQDPGHAGSALAELDARLQWVAFDES